jgi:hypothetical protein
MKKERTSFLNTSLRFGINEMHEIHLSGSSKYSRSFKVTLVYPNGGTFTQMCNSISEVQEAINDFEKWAGLK